MDSWYGMGFDTEDGMKGLTLSVIDFGSQTSAQGHFEKMTAETPGLEIMSLSIGDASAGLTTKKLLLVKASTIFWMQKSPSL